MQHAYNALTSSQIGTSWVCVRFYPRSRPEGSTLPKGIVVHENTGHSAMGVVSVGVDPGCGDLRLEVDMPDGGAIGCPVVTPDSSLTMRGITFGPSGGNKITQWRASKPAPITTDDPYGRKQLDLRIGAHYDHLVDREYANVWIMLLHDLSAVPSV